jgi:hypothetical protein
MLNGVSLSPFHTQLLGAIYKHQAIRVDVPVFYKALPLQELIFFQILSLNVTKSGFFLLPAIGYGAMIRVRSQHIGEFGFQKEGESVIRSHCPLPLAEYM